MLNISSTITLDLLRPSPPQFIYAKQGESLSRTAEIKLLNGGVEWEVPSGAQFIVCYAKEDGKGGKYTEISEDGNTIAAAESDGNTITVNFPKQAFTCAGNVCCEVRILSESSILSTFTFYLKVQPSPESSIESEDFFGGISADELREDIGDLSNLKTEEKSSLVAAINEVEEEIEKVTTTDIPALESGIDQLDLLRCASNAQMAEIMRQFAAMLQQLESGGEIAIPTVDTQDAVAVKNIGLANILRTKAEQIAAAQTAKTEIPSVGTVEEMIDAKIDALDATGVSY